MKLEGSFVFDGPREEAWEILQDPEVLKASLPNTQKLEKVKPDEYLTEMQVRMGPVSAKFKGSVSITDKVEPEQYRMNIEAKGTAGHGKGEVVIKLEEQDEGTTLMKYEGDFKVGGKLASLGQRLIDNVAKSVSKKTLEGLNQAIKERSGKKES